MIRTLVWMAALVTISCGRHAGSFPVPEQRSLNLGVDPGIVSFIQMDDPAANDYIVKDIASEPGVYRWAFLHPELRFRVAPSKDLRFTAELAVPEVTFKVTGPVNVKYALDGKDLGSLHCDHVGKYRISQAVPPGWLASEPYVHVTFETDRRWVSKEDGAQLSFLLFNAGFQP